MPKLIIIGGSLATGKTSLARFLEEQTGIKRLSMDDLKETFFDLGGYRDRDWSKRIGGLAWPTFKELVDMHLERGDDVIAEATFLWPDDHEWVQDLGDRHGAELHQVWMTADPRVSRERFIARANSEERHPGHCDDLVHVIDEFDQRFFNKTFIPMPVKGKTMVVDTTDFDLVDRDEVLQWIQGLS